MAGNDWSFTIQGTTLEPEDQDAIEAAIGSFLEALKDNRTTAYTCTRKVGTLDREDFFLLEDPEQTQP